MSRFEYKYCVPLEDLSRLRRAFSPFVERDPYVPDEVGEYMVHSIYFDTLSLDYYHQKEAGIQHRKKIRVRGYNDEGASPVFLEIKRKNNAAISKHRAPVLYEHLGDLFAGGDVGRYVLRNNGFVHADEEARRFFYHVYRYALRPVALIRYEREAFFGRWDDSVRITFDKNIRSSPYPTLGELFRENDTVLALPEYFVLEVKFHKGLPSWVKAILEDFHLERTSVSKYTICLDTHGIPQRSSTRSTAVISTSHPLRPGTDVHMPSMAVKAVKSSTSDPLNLGINGP